jgi:hypothetical protein
VSGLTSRKLAGEQPTWLYDKRRGMQAVLGTACSTRCGEIPKNEARSRQHSDASFQILRSIYSGAVDKQAHFTYSGRFEVFALAPITRSRRFHNHDLSES